MGFGFGVTILAFIANAINIGYWIFVTVVMCSIFFALKGKTPIWGRVIVSFLIGCILMSWPIINHLSDSRKAKAAKTRYQAADAHFQECCKKAGVTIHRTVDNVEGVLLMKLRPKWNPYDQNMIDPYGDDYGFSSGDPKGYIGSFLIGRNEKGYLIHKLDQAVRPGYRYVDVIEADGKRYRYTGYMDEIWKRDPSYLEGYSRFTLKKALAKGPPPRYGVTYDDIATPEERKMWIAGSSLKIIDLKTNEVIAERIGYMFDRGMGATGGGRSPWQHAARWACPSFPGKENPLQSNQTREFTEQVLKIRER